MTARNLFGALALDTTVDAVRSLLSDIKAAVTGVLNTKSDTKLITGSAGALNAVIDGATDLTGYSSVRLQVNGTWSGGLFFETSNDGTNWNTVFLNGAQGSTSFTTGNSTYYGSVPGRYFRLKMSTYTSGTATVNLIYSAASVPTWVGSLVLSAGTSTIGNIRQGFVTATGSLSALNAVADGTTDLNTYSSVRVQVTGTFSGLISFESSVDGTTWTTQYLSTGSGDSYGFVSGPARFYGDVGGRYFRARMGSYTSGTATVSILYSSASSTVANRQMAIIDGSGNGISITGGSPLAGTQAVVVAQKPSTVDLGNVAHKAPAVISGSIAANGVAVDGTTDLLNYASVRLQLSGTWVGTVIFQTSVDGTTWTSRYLQSTTSNLPASSSSNSNNGIYFGDIGGRYFRVITGAYTSGTIAVAIAYSAAPASHSGVQATLRALANSDAQGAGSTDLVAGGAFNGSTIDRVVSATGVLSTGIGRAVLATTGGYSHPSVNAQATPVAGTGLNMITARAAHTMQVDVTTTAAATSGSHLVRLEGSLDGTNWMPIGSVQLAASSTTATDTSNHGNVSVSDTPYSQIRANWVSAPTGWTGTLMARVISA